MPLLKTSMAALLAIVCSSSICLAAFKAESASLWKLDRSSKGNKGCPKKLLLLVRGATVDLVEPGAEHSFVSIEKVRLHTRKKTELGGPVWQEEVQVKTFSDEHLSSLYEVYNMKASLVYSSYFSLKIFQQGSQLHLERIQREISGSPSWNFSSSCFYKL